MRTILIAIVLAFGLFQSTSAQEPLTLAATIELPRVEGRIDHLSFDPASQRLFVAALGNNTVEVVDLRTNTVAKSVPGFHEPQGLQVVPPAKSVAVANGQSGKLQWLDLTSYQITRTTSLGDDADNVRYDGGTRVYVGYGSGAIAAVGADDGKVQRAVKLAGHPESFQLERSGPRIFVNVPTADQIAVIDRSTMKVTATWPVVTARANYPMALDEAGHRLFIGCRRPAKVLLYDTTSGKEVSAVDIVGDTDDLFFDAAKKRLYVSGGDGFIDVVRQLDANHFARLSRVPTAAGARTSLFVPEQNRLYLAVPHRGTQKAEIRVYEAR